MVEARVAHALSILILPPTGERNDRHALGTRNLAQPASHFVAIHVRHAEIEQYDVRLVALELREGGRSVVRDVYVGAGRVPGD